MDREKPHPMRSLQEHMLHAAFIQHMLRKLLPCNEDRHDGLLQKKNLMPRFKPDSRLAKNHVESIACTDFCKCVNTRESGRWTLVGFSHLHSGRQGTERRDDDRTPRVEGCCCTAEAAASAATTVCLCESCFQQPAGSASVSCMLNKRQHSTGKEE